MSSSMNKILIIGGTSGIGLHFAKRWHKVGKKTIVTGRPGTNRLAKVEEDLPGCVTYGLDVTDLQALPGHVEALFTQHPDIDTVWVNAGIMNMTSVKDTSDASDAKIIAEVTTNITAPMVLAQHVIPRLIASAKPANFLITSSGLAFAPNGKFFPVYCATKAAIHTYLVGMRQALADTKVNVIELVPPYVEGTELGPELQHLFKNLKGMTLDEYSDETFQALDNTPAEQLKEVAAGSAVQRVEAWRNGTGKFLAENGLGG